MKTHWILGGKDGIFESIGRKTKSDEDWSWEPKGAPPMPPPQEIAGLIKGLLTTIVRGGGGIGGVPLDFHELASKKCKTEPAQFWIFVVGIKPGSRSFYIPGRFCERSIYHWKGANHLGCHNHLKPSQVTTNQLHLIQG